MGKKGKRGGKGGGGGGGGDEQNPPPGGSGGQAPRQPAPQQQAPPAQAQGRRREGPVGEPAPSRQDDTAFPSLGAPAGRPAWGGARGGPQQGPPQPQPQPVQQQGGGAPWQKPGAPPGGPQQRPPQQQQGGPQQRPPQQQQGGPQQRPPQQQQGGPQQRPPQQQQGGPQQRPPQQQQGGPQQRPPQQQQGGPQQRPPQQQQGGPQQRPPQQQQGGVPWQRQPQQQQPPPQQQGYRQPGPSQQPRTEEKIPSPQEQPVQRAQAPTPQHTPKVSPDKLEGDFKNMGSGTLGLTIPKRSERPRVPKKGRNIIVETNHLALNIKNPKMQIVHYDVAVNPEKPFRFYRPALDEVQKRCYPNRFPAFDGRKNLYAYPELPFNKKELVETVQIYDEERQSNKDVTVTIKYAARVDLSLIQDYLRGGSSTNTPQQAIQALDIVLRQPGARRFVTVGRSFFTKPPGQVISLGDGLDLWYGFFQSAIIGWKPYLNIDVAHKGFPSPMSCLDIICDICRCSQRDLENPNFQLMGQHERMLTEQIKGLKVIQEIPNNNIKRTYKVIGLDKCPRNNSFECEDRATGKTQRMTVEEYFRNNYRHRLRFPHLPCIKAGSKDKSASLPIELCRIMEGQVTVKKMNDNQTRNMVKEAAVDTDRRKRKIIQSMREISFNTDPSVMEFGLSVADSFTKVEARILSPPTIDYKDKFNKNIVKVNVEKGVWRLFNNKFLLGADVSKWAILNTNKRVRDQEIRNLSEGLISNGKECGLNISSDVKIVVQEQQNKIQDFFQTCIREDVKLVVVVLPEKGVTYAAIKKMAELQVGVLTQCLKTNTVQRRANQATFVNILQKINAKLNGVNHNITGEFWPDFFRAPVMVVGADVTHPAPDQSFVPSIAAVAASHDPKAFKYNMIWKLQPPRAEVIADLKNIMIEQLKFFYRMTRQKPQKILFYRDGVSEGHFRQILHEELRAIRDACHSMGADYEPPITFLVVQKRHHTRFFPAPADADGKNKNVPAGTVVDTEITHPTELDFYLVSHASIQGTARPTKYHLLWDDSNMSEQQLEEITYYLCHLFTRCTRSVSYPAPTYYAHLAAFRARSYTELEERDRRLNLDNLDREQEIRKVKKGIVENNPMFFV